MINALWIIPLCFVGTVLFLALEWRALNWLGKRTRPETLDRWADRLFPGIAGRTSQRKDNG